MEDKKQYIEMNITLSRIVDMKNVNKEVVDSKTRIMIDDIADRYIEYRIKYQSMDLDIESENKIYVKFSASSISGMAETKNLDKVGENTILNFEHRLLSDKSLTEYKVEKVDYKILKA